MTPFHVGMKVVCVDSDPRSAKNPKRVTFVSDYMNGLKEGEVYTVRDIGLAEFVEIPCLWLQEIYRFPLVGSQTMENGFSVHRFRPVHENRMNELRSLLVTPPSKAKTKKQVSA